MTIEAHISSRMIEEYLEPKFITEVELSNNDHNVLVNRIDLPRLELGITYFY
jgi:hypothetical protein